MASQISEDKQSQFEMMLTFADYIASYINPEAVQKVKASRKDTRSMTEKDFLEVIKRLSGENAAKDLQTKINNG